MMKTVKVPCFTIIHKFVCYSCTNIIHTLLTKSTPRIFYLFDEKSCLKKWFIIAITDGYNHGCYPINNAKQFREFRTNNQQ